MTGVYKDDRAAGNAAQPWRSVTVEVSGRCNLSCEYCEVSQLGTEPLMTPTTFEALKGVWSKTTEACLSELSEPLMNRHLCHYIAAIKAENQACATHLISNATLLTRDMGRRLLKAGLDTL